MSERYSFEKTKFGASFTDAPDDGHGATGEVKKASFWGREVKVQGHDLNAGSLIDFLNKQHGATLEKGWLFGLGGSSKEEIQKAFDRVYPIDTDYKARFDEAKKSFVNMNSIRDPLIEDNYKTEQPSKYSSIMESEKTTILTPDDNSKMFEGIFITTMKRRRHADDKPNDVVLHICFDDEKLSQLPDDIDSFSPSYEKKLYENARADAKNILAPLLEQAIEELLKLDLPMPTHFCCDYDEDYGANVVREWQKQNAKQI